MSSYKSIKSTGAIESKWQEHSFRRLDRENLPSVLLVLFAFGFGSYHQTPEGDSTILHMNPWAEEKVIENIDALLEISDHSCNQKTKTA